MNVSPTITPIRLATFVALLNAFVSTGFAIAGIISPQAIVPAGVGVNEAASVFALYAAARTVPILAFVVWAVARRNVQALLLLGCLMGVIQFFDGIAGIISHDPSKVIGPWLIASVQAVSVLWLSRRPGDSVTQPQGAPS